MKKIKENIGVGRRKTSVASVRLRKGSGKIDINGRELSTYFPTLLQQKTVLSPMDKCSCKDQYDLVVRVKGGGLEGQAVAARLGLSRALVDEDEARRSLLKGEGFLTRDPRKRERKKYGRAGARRKFQFSKR